MSNRETCPTCHKDGVIEEFKAYGQRYIKSQDERGYPSFWHTPPESQGEMELDSVCTWAEELHKRHGIDIRNIENNLDATVDKFPDCIAEMDGKRIGVEVTEFTVDDRERKKYLKGKAERSKKTPSPKVSVPSTADWPLCKFQKKLKEIVHRKDYIARKKQDKGKLMPLHKMFLLIVTDEPSLVDILNEYLQKTEVPHPSYFMDVYVMTSYDPTEGGYPVFKVCLLPTT